MSAILSLYWINSCGSLSITRLWLIENTSTDIATPEDAFVSKELQHIIVLGQFLLLSEMPVNMRIYSNFVQNKLSVKEKYFEVCEFYSGNIFVWSRKLY